MLKNNYFVQAGDTVTGCVNNNYLTQHQDISGKENTSNKVKSTSGWSSTTTDDHYPSEKLVKDSLDTKQGHLSLSSAEIDEYGNSIFTDDGSYFYSTNDRIYHDWGDTDELHFIDSNGNDVNFDDISLNGHPHNISNITNLQSTLNNKLETSDLLDLIYPIGSIYMEKDTTSHSVCPIQLTLGGTWTRIENRFLYASEGGQGVGSTGGSETVTLTAAQSGVPAHGHGMAHTHNHRHTMSRRDTYHGSGSAAGAVGYTTSLSLIANSSYDNTASSKSTTDNNTAQDASEAHNNMPPYVIVNVWERTA